MYYYEATLFLIAVFAITRFSILRQINYTKNKTSPINCVGIKVEVIHYLHIIIFFTNGPNM